MLKKQLTRLLVTMHWQKLTPIPAIAYAAVPDCYLSTWLMYL